VSKLLSRIHIRHLMAREVRRCPHPPCYMSSYATGTQVLHVWARVNALLGAALCHTLCQHIRSWHTSCHIIAHHCTSWHTSCQHIVSCHIIAPHHRTAPSHHIMPHHGTTPDTIHGTHRTQRGVSCPTVRHTIDHSQWHTIAHC